MTFIGQLGVGPRGPISHPFIGRLFVFLCNSDPTTGRQCETWNRASGASLCYVQPSHLSNLPPQPLGEGEGELLALEKAVQRNETDKVGGKLLVKGIERVGRKQYFPYLTRQYTVRPVEMLSVQLPENWTDEQMAHVDAISRDLEVQVGGFAQWVQDEIRMACSCGAPADLLLQFDAFDSVINLGDAGRAYVFGCRDRHAPDAFYLEWQCS